MNKLQIIGASLALVATVITGCGGAEGDDPGRIYMPDMTYSRAYEAYGYNSRPEEHDLKSRGAYYTGMPVAGTVARGDAAAFPLAQGDSGYAQAKNFNLPRVPLDKGRRAEAERLYLINCAICHGAALDGNGPLWKGGDGPYPAAPRNLTDDYSKALSDAQIYHAIQYGKGQMGSYAGQLKPEQRMWVITYIREKQNGGGGSSGTAATPAGTTADTSATAAPATSTERTTNIDSTAGKKLNTQKS